MVDKVTPGLAAHDLSGRELGDYRVLRRLGRGAMAEVYLAEQVSLERQVALKVLHPQLSVDETYIKRFQLEARAAAALVHANIVQIYEVGCVDGIHYIAQEYVQGQNLQQLLSRHGPVETKLALAIMRQVAAALAKAAAQSIVHRDIKPENIMLASSGEVKVADFGLARTTSNGTTVNLTQVGVTMGTPLYMSPEQVEGGKLDPSSDIYSFGITCFHMLTGSPPFQGETPLSVAVQHLHKLPPRLENVRPDLPPSLCRIVHRMMSKEASSRYPTARDLLVDLRSVDGQAESDDWTELLDEETIAQLSDTAPTTGEATARLAVVMRETIKTSKTWRWWTAWAAALIVTMFVGAFVGRMIRTPSLLDSASGGISGYEKMVTVGEQYVFAMNADTIEAWRSIEEHYPDNEEFVVKAQQQIARIYLHQDEYDNALELFEQFAQPEQPKDAQAFGLAGEVVVYTLTKQYDQATHAYFQLRPLRDHLDDRQMRNAVHGAVQLLEREQKDLKQQTLQEWEAWEIEQFGPSDG